MITERQRLAAQRRAARTQRTVWAALTRRPRASLYELSACTGIPTSTVHDAIYALRAAGYIDFFDGAKRAREILVPFVMTKRTK